MEIDTYATQTELDMDVIALSETKKKRIGTKIVNNYLHVFIEVTKDRGNDKYKRKHKISDFETGKSKHHY